MLDTLRPAQREILGYQGGHLAVSAVPGAGKTFILTHLAAHLIGTLKVKPSHILILTYMRSAANTFKTRITKELAKQGIGAYGLQAMTIHAFCLSVVRRALADEEGLAILSEPEQFRILQDGLEAFFRDPARKKDWEARYQSKDAKENDRFDPIQATCQAARKVISAAKNFELAPLTVEQLLAEQPELGFLTRYYAETLDRMNLMDYDDLVQGAIRFLKEDQTLLAWYQKKARFVMEDEAQDSTPAQAELIRLLTSPEEGGQGNLVRVGDSNQAIMTSFTFNDPRYFREFCHNPSVKHVPMDESSRSALPVIGLANRLIDLTEKHSDPSIRQTFETIRVRPATAGKENPPPNRTPTWTLYESRETEQLEVLAAARSFLHEHPEQRAAVLVFSNAMREEYRDKALALDLPLYEDSRKSSNLSRAVIELLGKTLDFLSIPAERQTEAFLGVLDATLAIRGERWRDKKAVTRFLSGIPLEGLIYPPGLPPARPKELSENDYLALVRVTLALRDLLGARHLPANELLPTIADRLLADERSPLISAKAAAIALRYAPEGNDPLERIRLELERLNAAGGREIIASSEELAPREPGQLEILTLHKSKGAEFDAVWLPSLGYFYFPWQPNDGLIRDRQSFLAEQAILQYATKKPLPLKEAEKEAQRLLISERLRLLYVGITRAEREIHLSCYCGGTGKPLAPNHVLDLIAKCERRTP